MRQFLEKFSSRTTKPEFEIYDLGMVNNLVFLNGLGLAVLLAGMAPGRVL